MLHRTVAGAIFLLAGQAGTFASRTPEPKTQQQTTKSSVIIWEEEFPSESDQTSTSNNAVPRRKIWSADKEEPLSPFAPSSSSGQSVQAEVRQPHKLRTDRWQLHVQWRGKRIRERLEFEFSENGFVRMISADNATAAIGQWELASHGLTWTLPMPDQDRVIFHGDLLLNPFGPQPKIIRGIVLRETRRVWFRPVVATFTGDGTGEDTADLSYRNRKSTI
eukprot:scaffold3136_cov161-Amphora_coffeaeformis.AAC.2